MKIKNEIPKLVFCLVIAFLLSRDCVTDDFCDPDPIYGGCSSVCSYENVSLVGLGFKTYGFYMFGYVFAMIGKEKSKDQ